MERTDIVGKALPKVRELQAHLKELGLEVTLTVKSVNSVAGRPGPAKRRTRTAAAPVSYQDAAA
jgi:hypothetical protein